MGSERSLPVTEQITYWWYCDLCGEDAEYESHRLARKGAEEHVKECDDDE